MTAGSWHGWRGRERVERVDRPPITTDRLWAQHAEEWRCVVPEAFMGNDSWLAGKRPNSFRAKRQQCTALLTCSGSLATCRSCGWWEQTGRYGRVLREIWLLTCVTEIWLKALMNGVRGAVQNRIRSKSEVFSSWKIISDCGPCSQGHHWQKSFPLPPKIAPGFSAHLYGVATNPSYITYLYISTFTNEFNC